MNSCTGSERQPQLLWPTSRMGCSCSSCRTSTSRRSGSKRFDDDLVAGGTVTPGLEILHVHARSDRDSLVRVRMDYVRELCTSVESL